MKKYAMFFAALSAAVMISSCAKEQPVEPEEILSENGLVPMTFTASAENASSKAVLNSDGKTVEWEGSESISVFDDVNDTNHKFDAETSGENTSFTGEVNSSSSSFVAVYPYNAGIVYDSGATNPISYEIPRIQEATLGSFDPKAAVFVSTSDDISKKFTFKAAFALLKVNVDVDDVVAVYAENTGANMSGSVKIGTDGTIEDGTEDMFKYVCLKNSDDSPLSTGTYYIVVRYLDADPLSSFSLTYVKSDAAFKTRVKSSDIDALSRKAILDLGSLSGIPGSEEVSWYKYYQAFLDVKIGSKTINRIIDGNAVLLTADNTVTTMAKASIENGGVVFMKAIGSGSFTQSNNPSVKTNTFLLSDKSTNVSLTMLNNVINLADGALYLKNLDLKTNVDTKKNAILQVNKNDSKSMSHFVMDGCKVYLSITSMVTTNSIYQDYGITNIEIVNSSFALAVAANIISISKEYGDTPKVPTTGISKYKNFVFKNNYVYSVGEDNLASSIFAYTGSNGDDDMVVQIDNNLFYNAVTGGVFKHKTIASATAKKNVFWAKDGTDPGANIKLWGMSSKVAIPSVNVADNLAFGTLGNPRKWTIADNTVNTGMEAIKVELSNPIATADTATGTFIMASGYESYGPQAL